MKSVLRVWEGGLVGNVLYQTHRESHGQHDESDPGREIGPWKKFAWEQFENGIELAKDRPPRKIRDARYSGKMLSDT